MCEQSKLQKGWRQKVAGFEQSCGTLAVSANAGQYVLRACSTSYVKKSCSRGALWLSTVKAGSTLNRERNVLKRQVESAARNRQSGCCLLQQALPIESVACS